MAKKPTAKKPVAKKPATKKAPAKKPAAKKPAASKKKKQVDRQRATELLHVMGGMIINDENYADRDWQAMALVIEVEDGCTSMSGYIYPDAKTWEPEMPEEDDILDVAQDLHAEMVAQGDPAWKAILIQITQPDLNITMEFEYGDLKRWKPDYNDLSKLPKLLRPKP